MGRVDLNAVQAEAESKPHGPYVLGEDEEEFYLPRLVDWPAEATELVEDGRLPSAFRLAMGDEEYERFAAHRPTLRQYNAIFDDITADEGLGDSGNSSGSSASSRSTRAKSKRTSPATTASA